MLLLLTLKKVRFFKEKNFNCAFYGLPTKLEPELEPEREPEPEPSFVKSRNRKRYK
jgi:hypothetical protein